MSSQPPALGHTYLDCKQTRKYCWPSGLSVEGHAFAMMDGLEVAATPAEAVPERSDRDAEDLGARSFGAIAQGKHWRSFQGDWKEGGRRRHIQIASCWQDR